MAEPSIIISIIALIGSFLTGGFQLLSSVKKSECCGITLENHNTVEDILEDTIEQLVDSQNIKKNI